MATRFYFDDNNYWDGGTSNPATPAYYSGWHETNAALRTGLKVGRPGNAFSQTTIQKNVAGTPKYGLARVYVSDVIPGSFTIRGNVRGQFLCQEQAAANDEMRAVVVRAWDPVKNVFRSPAVLVHLPATIGSEFNDVTTQNRNFPPVIPVTPVNIHKGDRLVVEVGIAFFNTGTGAGITGLFRTGNPSGSLDLPIDESYTIPEAAAWIEFDLDFPTGAPVNLKSYAAPRAGKAISPSGGLDYLFELVAPDGTRHDVTDRTSLEGLSRLTLVIERNLHDFRAGDLSVTFDDGDGFFTDLFALLEPSDRWKLNVDRDGARHFSGVIPGIDSIRFDKKEFTVEVTALDLSKLLEDISADVVSRDPEIYALGADVAVSATTVTLNSTAGLYNGDTLSLTSDAIEEQITIALVTSGTQVTLTQATSNAFTAVDTAVLLVTRFFRYKTPEYLINALIDAAGDLLSGRSIRLAAAPSNLPIFSYVSTNRLGGTTVPNSWTQKGSNHFARIGSASFEQTEPAEDWTSVAPDRQWVDWTPYRTQAQGEPATFATAPALLSLAMDTFGFDYTVGAFVAYHVSTVIGFPQFVELNKWTSADGTTWSAKTFVATLVDLGAGNVGSARGTEFDPVRNRVYFAWTSNVGLQEFGYWDVAGAAKVSIDLTEERGKGMRYSREFDGLVVYNSTQDAVEVWRDTEVLLTYSGPFAGAWTPPYTRYLNGAWYNVAYPQGVPSVLFTRDDFETVSQIKLAGKPTSGTSPRRITIVDGSIRVAVNANPDAGSAPQARMFIGADIFAGVIPYADFEGQSLIGALDELAILLNAAFFVDAEATAHFVLRVLDSGAEVKDIEDLVTDRVDEPIWLELYDYVEFKLPDGEISRAGQQTSTSRNLSVEIQLVASFSVATAAAEYLLGFFQRRRKHSTVGLDDDGSIYGLLDRVRLDGIEWLVYSVDRDLANYEVGLELIEKVD